LRLAVLQQAYPKDTADYGPIRAAIDILQQDGTLTVGTGEVDLVPILTGGALALTGPDGMLDPLGHGSSPRVTARDGEDATAATLRLLENAAHATRVRAILTGLGAGRGFGITGAPLKMETERRAGVQVGSDCAKTGTPTPHDPTQGVSACDELWLTLTNQSGRVQDVSVFYLAQDFTLSLIWPQNNLSNRLALGESTRVGLRIDAADPTAFAAEEILVVALSPDVDEPRADLSALASPDRLRATGSDPTLATIAVLMDPQDTTQTRGFSTKRPALTLLRQSVHLRPATPTKLP
ncbi:hypothetical protein, partial [Pseudorhodobacter sp.]|uniref:hypothetical protein n=1 Tax=Pseudorhodobacter sp. TaxID=1934400 RepID=UPI0026481E63